MAADERTWTTHQLARLSGMSYRVADYAVRTGVLVPAAITRAAPGSGSVRRFTSRQVAVARVVALLGNLGAGIDVRRAVASRLAEDEALWAERVFVDPAGLMYRHVRLAPVVAGWLVDLAQVWADADQATAAELDGELALVG